MSSTAVTFNRGQSRGAATPISARATNSASESARCHYISAAGKIPRSGLFQAHQERRCGQLSAKSSAEAPVSPQQSMRETARSATQASLFWDVLRAPQIRISDDGCTVTDTARKPASGDDGLGRFRTVKSAMGAHFGRHEWNIKILSPGKFLVGVCTGEVGCEGREDNHQALHQIPQAWVICTTSDGTANIRRWHRGKSMKTGLACLDVGSLLGVVLDIAKHTLTFTVNGASGGNSTFTDLPVDKAFFLAVSFGGDEVKGCSLEVIGYWSSGVSMLRKVDEWSTSGRSRLDSKTSFVSDWSRPDVTIPSMVESRPHHAKTFEVSRAMASTPTCTPRIQSKQRSESEKRGKQHSCQDCKAWQLQLAECRDLLNAERDRAARLQRELDEQMPLLTAETSRLQKVLDTKKVQHMTLQGELDAERKSAEQLRLQRDDALQRLQDVTNRFGNAKEGETLLDVEVSRLQRLVDARRSGEEALEKELQKAFAEVSHLQHSLDAKGEACVSLQKELSRLERTLAAKDTDMRKEVVRERIDGGSQSTGADDVKCLGAEVVRLERALAAKDQECLSLRLKLERDRLGEERCRLLDAELSRSEKALDAKRNECKSLARDVDQERELRKTLELERDQALSGSSQVGWNNVQVDHVMGKQADQLHPIAEEVSFKLHSSDAREEMQLVAVGNTDEFRDEYASRLEDAGDISQRILTRWDQAQFTDELSQCSSQRDHEAFLAEPPPERFRRQPSL